MASASSSSSSSLSNNDDWELVNVDDADSISDMEWVITGDDVYFVPGRSMSGVFVPFKNKPAFVSFQANHSYPCDPSLPPSSVSSSSNGLIISRGSWSSYSVSNPSTGTRTFLPKPPRAHHPNSPLAIVLNGPAYQVISAVAGACMGSYSFSTFSSSRGTWNYSKEEFVLTRIMPNTGVSCLCFAYWRTESQMVAVYDVLADQARILIPPEKVLEAGDRWQLGRVGEKLCCALVTGSNLEVYALGMKDQWVLLYSIVIVVTDKEEWNGGEPIVCQKLPQPLRFESHELEVLLMVDGKLVMLGLENKKMRMVQFEKPAPGCYDEFVPYIDNPYASVDFTVEILPAK